MGLLDAVGLPRAAAVKSDRAVEVASRRRQVATNAAAAAVTCTFTQTATTGLTGTVVSLADTAALAPTLVRFSNSGAARTTTFGAIAGQTVANPAGAAFYGVRARSASGGDTWGGHQTYDYSIETGDHEFQYQFIQGLTGWMNVYVDDILVGTWTSAYVADQYWLCRITPTARRSMHVRIETNMGFRRINSVQGDRAWLPKKPLYTRRVYVKGDSWIAGSQDPTGRAWIGYLSEYMGWECLRGGYSGTGYTTNGGGASGKLDFPTSVATDIVPQAPDLVVIAGSINDQSATAAALQTAAQTTYSNLATGLPGVPVIVVGPQYGLPSGPSNTVCDTMQAALVAAAAQSPNVIGVISTKAWFTGTGDAMVAGDGVHPLASGHAYYAQRLKGEIEALVATKAI